MEPAYKAVKVETNTTLPDTSPPDLISEWPTDPQRMASQPLWIIVDFLLLLMPIAFIVLAALAHQLDGAELSDRGKSIQEATLIGPTLFPLAFAALGGRSIKRIALWRAERGTTLGFLEHMIGSQSLVGTVGHAFALRSFDFLSISLLIMWALSPLGGQSALRLVHETNSTRISNRYVFYADVDASSEFPKESYNEDAFNRANAVLSTSLMTADNLDNSTVDTWNHPKIPRIEALEQAEERNETARDWYVVDPSTNYTYASLAGISVVHLAEKGTTNFTVPYEYMYFGCELSPHNNLSRYNSSTPSTPEQYFPYQMTQLNYLNGLNDANILESGGHFHKNTTQLSTSDNLGKISLDAYRSLFIYTRTSNTNNTRLIPQALIYGSSALSTTTFWIFECSMKSVLVEANIICDKDTCGVQRLRRLSIPRSQRAAFQYLPYDVIRDGYTNSYLIRHLAEVGGKNSLFKPNPVDAYIYGNGAWTVDEYGVTPGKRWYTYINNTEKTNQMSRRMTRVLNTFWDASRWPTAMTRNDPFARISLNASGLPPSSLTMKSTEAIISEEIPVYRADSRWVACLVLCSSVLLLLGLYSFFLHFRITVPDIFDYVSSFTRDNPYARLPDTGSTLDGAERAKLLRKLRVQLGDIDIDGETGYIAIRRVDGTKDCEMGQIRKDRMYR